MNRELKKLITALELELVEKDFFKAFPIHPEWLRIYGGQHLSQSVAAAYKTVEKDFVLVSFHGYFLQEGEVKDPVDIRVTRLRDGKSTCISATQPPSAGAKIIAMGQTLKTQEKAVSKGTPFKSSGMLNIT